MPKAGRRIVLDALAASTGGQMTRARAFLARLRKHDPDSEYWLLEENDALSAPAQAARVQTVNRHMASGVQRPFFRMSWQNTRLPGWLRAHAIDTYLSFSHYLPSTLPHGIRTVVGVSNLAPFSADARAAETTLRGRARLAILEHTIVVSCRRADRVIALSEACREVLTARGVDAHRIVVIPNGVEPPAPPPAVEARALRARHGVPDDYLLYVSHFYPYKNMERLIAAYAALPADLIQRYALVIVGVPHDQGYYERVRAAVAATPVAGRIVLVPGLSGAALAAAYAGATAFVFPSLVENCPNSLLEAMAYGVPVMTGENAPMPEFAGDTARFFDAHSAPSMTAALAAVLADPALRAQMAATARERALRYSWDEFTARVTALVHAE
jgi:glycosyltransferase involved in cell wall biosynthesis